LDIKLPSWVKLVFVGPQPTVNLQVRHLMFSCNAVKSASVVTTNTFRGIESMHVKFDLHWLASHCKQLDHLDWTHCSSAPCWKSHACWVVCKWNCEMWTEWSHTLRQIREIMICSTCVLRLALSLFSSKWSFCMLSTWHNWTCVLGSHQKENKTKLSCLSFCHSVAIACPLHGLKFDNTLSVHGVVHIPINMWLFWPKGLSVWLRPEWIPWVSPVTESQVGTTLVHSLFKNKWFKTTILANNKGAGSPPSTGSLLQCCNTMFSSSTSLRAAFCWLWLNWIPPDCGSLATKLELTLQADTMLMTTDNSLFAVRVKQMVTCGKIKVVLVWQQREVPQNNELCHWTKSCIHHALLAPLLQKKRHVHASFCPRVHCAKCMKHKSSTDHCAMNLFPTCVMQVLAIANFWQWYDFTRDSNHEWRSCPEF